MNRKSYINVYHWGFSSISQIYTKISKTLKLLGAKVWIIRWWMKHAATRVLLLNLYSFLNWISLHRLGMIFKIWNRVSIACMQSTSKSSDVYRYGPFLTFCYILQMWWKKK